MGVGLEQHFKIDPVPNKQKIERTDKKDKKSSTIFKPSDSANKYFGFLLESGPSTRAAASQAAAEKVEVALAAEMALAAEAVALAAAATESNPPAAASSSSSSSKAGAVTLACQSPVVQRGSRSIGVHR